MNWIPFVMILNFRRSEGSHSAKREISTTFLGGAKAEEAMRLYQLK